MQREIKFRAWDKADKVMKYFSCGIFNRLPAGAEDLTEPMQYTGLKDKNGKEIYEGDIIRFNNNEDDLCQVCFGEFPVYDIETEEVTDTAHGWYAKVVFTDGLSRLEPFCYDRILNNQWIGTLEIEVIGNIYEHTELLLEVSE